MFGILVALAIGLGLVSLLFASQAAMGAVIAGLGCLCGILARLAQAREQHGEMMSALRRAEADRNG